MKILFQTTKNTKPASAVEAAMVNQSMNEGRPMYGDWFIGSNGMPTNTYLDEVAVEPTFGQMAASNWSSASPYYAGGVQKTPYRSKLKQFNNWFRNDTGVVGEVLDNATPIGTVTALGDVAGDLTEGNKLNAALGAGFLFLPNILKKTTPFLSKVPMRIGTINPKHQQRELQRVIDQENFIDEFPLSHPYGKNQNMPQWYDMDDLTYKYNLAGYQSNRTRQEYLPNEDIRRQIEQTRDYYYNLAEKFKKNKQYDKAEEALEYARYLNEKQYYDDIPYTIYDVPVGKNNTGAANKIFDQYANAMTRRRDYLYYGLPDRLDYDGVFAIKNPNDFSFLIGQQGESGIFKPSHFAPETNRGGVELIKQAYNSSNPVLFAVTNDLSPMLSKIGYTKIGQAPQIFDGEIHMKDLMANRSLRLEDLANEAKLRQQQGFFYQSDNDQLNQIIQGFSDNVRLGNIPSYQTTQGTFFVDPYKREKGGLIKRRKI